jgi:hypothetical protein
MGVARIGEAETLLQLRAALAREISEESCVIVCLFHDIGKVGILGKPYYLPEIKDGKPTGVYSIIPEIVVMGLSLRSMYLFSEYIPLSDEGAQVRSLTMMGCMCLKGARRRMKKTHCCCFAALG